MESSVTAVPTPAIYGEPRAARDSVAAPRRDAATAVLAGSATFWFAVLVIGQWAFVHYVVSFYGPSTFSGNFQAWSVNKMAPRTYITGDTVGNLVFASHALLAAIIAFGGTLQLVPQIRNRFIAFHRWNGRVFLTTAMVSMVLGLYLVWIRKRDYSIGSIALTVDALLVFAFGIMAWRAARRAREGKIETSTHRRWALRAFIVVTHNWFLRTGFMAWIVVQQGPVAMKTFFSFWSFVSLLLPLAVLELYLRTKDSGRPPAKLAMAGLLVMLTLLMGAGTAAMFVGILWPLLGKV